MHSSLIIILGFVFSSYCWAAPRTLDVIELDNVNIVERAGAITPHSLRQIEEMSQFYYNYTLSEGERLAAMDLLFLDLKKMYTLAQISQISDERAASVVQVPPTVIWVPLPRETNAKRFVDLIVAGFCENKPECFARFDLKNVDSVRGAPDFQDILSSIEANHKGKTLYVFENSSLVLTPYVSESMHELFDQFLSSSHQHTQLRPDAMVLFIDQLDVHSLMSKPERENIPVPVATGHAQLKACAQLLQQSPELAN